MIETYGVDLTPLGKDKQFIAIHDESIPYYENLVRKNEEAMVTSKLAEEALDKLGDAVSDYQLCKVAFREAFKDGGDAAPSPICFMTNNLPPDVTLEQFEKIVTDLTNHVSFGADVFRPFVKVFQQVCERWSENRRLVEEKISTYRLIVKFWEEALDLIRIEYVFEHAEMKYKTKACREGAKIARSVISGGEIALRDIEKCCKGNPPDPSLTSHIRMTITLAENRAKVFVGLKGYIEENGIEAAFAKWRDAGRRIITL